MLYSGLQILLLQLPGEFRGLPGSSSPKLPFLLPSFPLRVTFCTTPASVPCTQPRECCRGRENRGFSLPKQAAAAGELDEHIKSPVLAQPVLPAHLNCSFSPQQGRKGRNTHLHLSCSVIWVLLGFQRFSAAIPHLSSAKSFVVTTGEGCSV